MMRNSLKNAQDGFTLVELMIAMTVFSLVLVAASAGLIQVGRTYYKGVITSRTQDTSRSIIDEISRSVQFSGESPDLVRDGSGNLAAMCLGNTRYSIRTDVQVGDTNPHGLYKDDAGATCASADLTTPQTGGVELLGSNMRFSEFDVEALGDQQYRIVVWVVYGDDDLLEVDPNNADRTICRGSAVGGQFCALGELSTVVTRRLL